MVRARYGATLGASARITAVFAVALIGCGSGNGEATDGGRDGAGGDDASATCTANADCDNGTFCDGEEVCDPDAANADDRGCVAGSGDPCMAGQECMEATDSCQTLCDTDEDADGDGVVAEECGGTDCDDSDPDRFPGNAEVCDADRHDEDCDPATVGSRDLDGDGFNDVKCCNPAPEGGFLCAEDCVDFRRGVNPDNPEVCNGLDDDCDGLIDEEIAVPGFVDADGDGFGDAPTDEPGCPGSPGFATMGGDCDDTDPTVNPGQVEICDMIDNDCDSPGPDSDIGIDEAAVDVLWYFDGDGDGYGTAERGTIVSCTRPENHALLAGDCDDMNEDVNPGAAEICDGLDNNCNGRADFRIGPGDFEDDDDDGVPDSACPVEVTDCDDEDPLSFPGGTEICDERDNDCDGTVDGPDAELLWQLDEDGDGYGDDDDPGIMSCEIQSGRVPRGGDCNDTDSTINPRAFDGCGGQMGVDDDCDEDVDEAVELRAFYTDSDGDGFGQGSPMLACMPPEGATGQAGDCDDDDVSLNPGADEMCNPGDMIDNDCDGLVDCQDFDCDGSPNCTIDKEIEVLDGNNQTTTVNQFAPLQVVIRVTDLAGTPLSGTEVSLTDPRGGAGAQQPVQTSDGSGIVRYFVRAGRQAGLVRFAIGATGARPVFVSLTATDAPDDTVFTLTNADRTFGDVRIPGPGPFARTGAPTGIAVNETSTVYIAESNRHRILRLSPAGRLDVVAGTGVRGNTGDFGPATDAQLNGPSDVALDLDESRLFIADTGNNRVRVMDLATGEIRPFAGGGSAPAPGYGDGGPAQLASISTPRNVAVGPDGMVYIGDNLVRVRTVPREGGTIDSLLVPEGNCRSVPLRLISCGTWSCAFAFDENGALYIAANFCGTRYGNGSSDYGVVRVEDDGTLTPVAGQPLGSTGDEIPARTADFDIISDIGFDAASNLYVVERNQHRIRHVNAVTSTLSTVLGTGMAGFTADGAAPGETQVDFPNSLAFIDRHLLWTDEDNYALRQAQSLGEETRGSASIEIDSGDMQTALVNDFLTTPLGVLLTDDAGDPIVGAEVEFEALTEGGQVLSSRASTNLSGVAVTQARLGLASGAYEFTAQASDLLGTPLGGSPLSFSATASEPTAGTVIPLINADQAYGPANIPGPGVSARLRDVTGLVTTSDGTLYIADQGSDRVYRMSPAGIVEPVAGNGTATFSGDGGAALDASVRDPRGLAVNETDGLLYIADTGNDRIRVVDLQTGQIDTFAGGGSAPSPSYGDGGPPTAATLADPRWVSIAPDGRVFIADSAHSRIRVVDPALNTIELFVLNETGSCSGESFSFRGCTGDFGCSMAWDGSDLIMSGRFCGSDVGGTGTVYGIARIDAGGTMTHLAGQISGMTGDGVAATSALIERSTGIDVDGDGNIYYVDNLGVRVRRIDATSGNVSTVMGDGTVGGAGDFGPAAAAQLDDPFDVVVWSGHVTVSDRDTFGVRTVW